MIRNPTDEQWNNATVTVITLNGDDYYNKDITDQPFNDDFNVITFWEDQNTITVYPMSQVQSVTFNLGVIEVVKEIEEEVGDE